MPETLESFDPLAFRPANPGELAAHARNIVKNVLDSYTGRFDVLAEAVQNAMDALEARWGNGVATAAGRVDGEKPTLRITLNGDVSANLITVTDNGTGIAQERLQEVFTPHLSPKLLDATSTRGHKGVGTTFLIYGHPSFEVRTKTAGNNTVGFTMTGGSEWVRSGQNELPPKFEPMADAGAVLDSFGAGTSITVKVDEATKFGRLRSAQYNSLKTWELVLRTYTAVGTIAISVPQHRLPEWLKELQVELALEGVAGAGKAVVEPVFRYPHKDAATAVSLQELWSGSVGENNRYDMLYVELGKNALEQALKSQIDELENSEQPDDQEILQTLRGYDTEVYASWTYKNTLYEDLYRGALGEANAKRYQYMNARGGLLVASVGMPVGETTEHPYSTMKPEYRRRMFMIASFNDAYSPDLGRKTIPAQDRRFLEWLERQVQNLFLRHTGRLVRANDEATHRSGSFAEAKEELNVEAEKLKRKASSDTELATDLSFAHQPFYEAELVGTFYAVLSLRLLRGYTLIAVPGSRTRFDGLFDFETDEFDGDGDDSLPLGIASSKARNGSFARKSKWLEFKVKLQDLIDDFEEEDGLPGKKYFDLVDLVVAWEVPAADAIGDYDLVTIDADNWNQRDYFGVTHLLKRGSSNHTVQVIALQDLLRQSASTGE